MPSPISTLRLLKSMASVPAGGKAALQLQWADLVMQQTGSSISSTATAQERPYLRRSTPREQIDNLVEQTQRARASHVVECIVEHLWSSTSRRLIQHWLGWGLACFECVLRGCA